MVFDSEAGVVTMVLDVDRGTTALAFEDRAGAVWLFFVVEDVEV